MGSRRWGGDSFDDGHPWLYRERVGAFTSAYGMARFCDRCRAVAVIYGLVAAYKAWRWRRSAPDSFTLRRRERLP